MEIFDLVGKYINFRTPTRLYILTLKTIKRRRPHCLEYHQRPVAKNKHYASVFPTFSSLNSIKQTTIIKTLFTVRFNHEKPFECRMQQTFKGRPHHLFYVPDYGHYKGPFGQAPIFAGDLNKGGLLWSALLHDILFISWWYPAPCATFWGHTQCVIVAAKGSVLNQTGRDCAFPASTRHVLNRCKWSLQARFRENNAAI